MGDAADDALAYGEAQREDAKNAADQARHEATCSCWHPDSGQPEPAAPDPGCPVHGRPAPAPNPKGLPELCPYFQGLGTCDGSAGSCGYYGEPLCITNQPEEGWEAERRREEPVPASCRCEPGDRHPLCDLHGEVAPPGEAPLPPYAPCLCSPASGWPDESCLHHGVDAHAGRWPTDLAPEPRDPWLTHYDPFAHGRL